MMRRLALLSFVALLFTAGCNSEPPLHEVTGKVTLDGKPYSRLLVYFDPVDGKVTKFNKGVGETDASGVLTLRSTAGGGLQAGEYIVSFNCYVEKGGGAIGLSDDKNDDNRQLVTEDLVPEEYASPDTSKITFEVTRGGDNNFEFDIPGK